MSSMFGESLRAFLRPVLEHLDDPEVSEIMINGPDNVWIERHGLLRRTSCQFTEDGLLAAARNMAQYVGRPLSEEHPRLDARLPDGSRIHVLLPPMARCGTVISIRKFFPGGLNIDDLIEFQTVTEEAARFLEAMVQTKKNIMVAGGTGSGKTTLLNVLSQFIPDDERILTVEDSAELQLSQTHLVPLEARPPDRHGRNAVTIRDLLHSALRLRPDRIVIGEVRGGECFDLLQAMNTGHGGMLSTCHANSALETLSRIESLALLADVGLPLRAVRAQVSSAINVVVCTARLRDGTRKLTSISEVLPLDEHGNYRVNDLFVFTQTQSERSGVVNGYLAPTGLLPSFQGKLAADGFDDLDEDFFSPAAYGYEAPRHFITAPVSGERPEPRRPQPAPVDTNAEPPAERHAPMATAQTVGADSALSRSMAAAAADVSSAGSSVSALAAPAALPSSRRPIDAAQPEPPDPRHGPRAAPRPPSGEPPLVGSRARAKAASPPLAAGASRSRASAAAVSVGVGTRRGASRSRSSAASATASGTAGGRQERRRSSQLPASMPAPPADAGDAGRLPEQMTNPDIDLQDLYGMHRDGRLQRPPTAVPTAPSVGPPAAARYDGAHDPGAHDPGAHDPGAHDPGAHDPGAYDPGAYDPAAYDPATYDHDAYDRSHAAHADAPGGGSVKAGDPYEPSPNYTVDDYEPEADDYERQDYERQGDEHDPYAVDEGEPTRFRPRPKPGE